MIPPERGSSDTQFKQGGGWKLGTRQLELHHHSEHLEVTTSSLQELERNTVISLCVLLHRWDKTIRNEKTIQKAETIRAEFMVQTDGSWNKKLKIRVNFSRKRIWNIDILISIAVVQHAVSYGLTTKLKFIDSSFFLNSKKSSFQRSRRRGARQKTCCLSRSHSPRASIAIVKNSSTFPRIS